MQNQQDKSPAKPVDINKLNTMLQHIITGNTEEAKKQFSAFTSALTAEKIAKMQRSESKEE
jgi:hypothetical protein